MYCVSNNIMPDNFSFLIKLLYELWSTKACQTGRRDTPVPYTVIIQCDGVPCDQADVPCVREEAAFPGMGVKCSLEGGHLGREEGSFWCADALRFSSHLAGTSVQTTVHWEENSCICWKAFRQKIKDVIYDCYGKSSEESWHKTQVCFLFSQFWIPVF